MSAPEGVDLPDHSEALAALVGRRTGRPLVAHSAVNQAMVHHWVEAMGDEDPVYLTDGAARAVGLERAIAPPTMLQAWTMPGLRATLLRDGSRSETPGEDGARPVSVHEEMMALLDAEGLTSVVATDCDQRYDRPLVPGDRLVASSVIEEISPPKRTALGTGRFVTTRTDFVAVGDVGPDADPEDLAAAGEPVATMRFRILKFRPASGPAEPRPLRPRPAITEDNAFWFEGARQHRLLIQRCTACGRLRHPPLPACPACRSFDWDTVTSTGRGELYSFVVVHHPQVPAFDYPLAVGLVELEEGTRLVADLDGLEPQRWRVGMAVEAHFVDFDDELSLPVFGPAGAGD